VSAGPDSLPALPFTLRPLVPPVVAERDGDALSIAAGPRTDWFVDPRTGDAVADAPALVGTVEGDFVLSARVEATLGAAFDAGALVVWRDRSTWAKLALELSPGGDPMVVSVVTRGVSDDCNSHEVDGAATWLRIGRIGSAFAFHASADGRRWSFVRHFRLGAEPSVDVGLQAQSPSGSGCTARFDSIRFEERTLDDLRSGA
jgi:uncharacterized protein